MESIGDEDVFTNGTNEAKTDIDDDNKSVTSEKGTPKKQKNKQSGIICVTLREHFFTMFPSVKVCLKPAWSVTTASWNREISDNT